MKYIIPTLLCLFVLSSCKKYLDEKPNTQWVVPETIQDAAALMDNYSLFNASFPFIGSQGDDDYYLLESYWNTLSITNQDNYRWEKEVYNKNEWSYMYQIVLRSNISLETVSDIVSVDNNIAEWKRVKGTALFHRANAFFQIAQYYAEPYERTTASQKKGIPLRLNSNINEPSVRSSLEATWQRIITDFKQASELLSAQVDILSKPTKQAAFAMLSRSFLTMGDYESAYLYADSCLQIQHDLINYNTLNTAANTPFTRFNKEVIFSSTTLGVSMLGVNNWRCDSLLFNSYHINDLRRAAFFKSNGSGTYGFKGNYDGTTSSAYFNGPAVDEIYFIRAECLARRGDISNALQDLDAVLSQRWKTGTFSSSAASTPEEALELILEERRKELVMRSIRWFDLRRLNKELRYAKTLKRKLNGVEYILPPNSPRYTHYIPLDVISITAMPQNDR